MKAAVYNEYGPPEVVKIKNIAKPVPKDNEVLIKIHATSVTSGDHRLRSWDIPSIGFDIIGRIIFGITSPRKHVLGTEISGEIEHVGKNVKKFKEGDQVYALTGIKLGGHAEYITLSEKAAIYLMPSNLSFEEAATVPFGATTALYFLRDLGKIKPGERVLIYGASGDVGSYAVQLAKFFKTEVTGVASTKNLHLLHSLGADHVIDYTKEDFSSLDESYDMIFDTVGKTSFEQLRHLLAPRGRFLTTVMTFKEVRQMLQTSLQQQQKILVGNSTGNTKDLKFIKALIEDGKLKPVIDRKYTLKNIVEAHRYVDRGHKKGSVVVTVM